MLRAAELNGIGTTTWFLYRCYWLPGNNTTAILILVTKTIVVMIIKTIGQMNGTSADYFKAVSRTCRIADTCIMNGSSGNQADNTNSLKVNQQDLKNMWFPSLFVREGKSECSAAYRTSD